MPKDRFFKGEIAPCYLESITANIGELCKCVTCPCFSRVPHSLPVHSKKNTQPHARYQIRAFQHTTLLLHMHKATGTHTSTSSLLSRRLTIVDAADNGVSSLATSEGQGQGEARVQLVQHGAAEILPQPKRSSEAASVDRVLAGVRGGAGPEPVRISDA